MSIPDPSVEEVEWVVGEALHLFMSLPATTHVSNAWLAVEEEEWVLS